MRALSIHMENLNKLRKHTQEKMPKRGDVQFNNDGNANIWLDEQWAPSICIERKDMSITEFQDIVATIVETIKIHNE